MVRGRTKPQASRGRGRPRKKPQNVPDVQPPSKRRKLAPLKFESHESDPIIEDLKNYKWDTNYNFDLVTETLDQIALEGLSGISFERLLSILEAVSPKLKCINDEKAQAYIWSVIIKLLGKPEGVGVKAYYLGASKISSKGKSRDLPQQVALETAPSPNDLRLSNKKLIIDKEIKLPKDTIERISKQGCSLFAIQDGFIMGSCQHYLTRQDVTEDILLISRQSPSPFECMRVAYDKYDFKLLRFVADQEVRRRAIMPGWSDPNIDIKLREYVCLELIGRTRSLGIVFPNDKAFGRYRILLTSKKLISQYQPTCTSHIVHHILRYSNCIRYVPVDGKIYKQELAPLSDEFNAEDSDDPADSDYEEISAKKACCLPRRLRIDSDMLKMVYHVIAHSRGRSPLDIRRKLRLPKFHVRNHLKNLANTELIGSHARRIDDQNYRIYRARHKSSVYRSKLKERLNKLKLRKTNKTKFDEVDLRAKSILGHRRSQFTQAEDSLLILCRICCLLIEPNLTKKVSFCVNKRFIRDLLHDELCESHDKTADACLRRIKYLRNLPNNIMSINELTAELQEDADVKRQLSSLDSSRSEEKFNKLFLQILKIVRTKLPQLLGIRSNPNSGNLVTRRRRVRMNSYQDLARKYELIDCESTSLSRYRPHPGPTVLQFAKSIDRDFRLDINECNEMPSIALLSSLSTHNVFDMELNLKIPPVIVGLDQGNENYVQMCAKAKDTTREILESLATSNPAADSRRALFMLRNELKTHALDKCGNLADALIVQPCNVRFSSSRDIEYIHEDLLDKFMNESKLCMAIVQAQESPGHQADDKEEIDEKANKDEGSGRMTSRQKKLMKDKVPKRDEANQVPEELGSRCITPLLKLIKLVLSWTFVSPGIEFQKLYVKVNHLAQTEENLHELLNLMIGLQLISENRLEPQLDSPTVGFLKVRAQEEPTVTYEPTSTAYLRYCQLLGPPRS